MPQARHLTDVSETSTPARDTSRFNQFSDVRLHKTDEPIRFVIHVMDMKGVEAPYAVAVADEKIPALRFCSKESVFAMAVANAFLAKALEQGNVLTDQSDLKAVEDGTFEKTAVYQSAGWQGFLKSIRSTLLTGNDPEGAAGAFERWADRVNGEMDSLLSTVGEARIRKPREQSPEAKAAAEKAAQAAAAASSLL